MKNIRKDFNISFVGLKQGEYQFEYRIGKSFFEVFKYEDFLDANVVVTLNFSKKSSMLELDFKCKGSVTVPCDLTNEPFLQPIKGTMNMVVKFGDEYNDDNDEILIISHSEHQINVAQYIYEMIIFAVPSKRIHPGIADGTLKSDILNKLKELAPKEHHDKEIDPRWSKLKDLKN